MSDFAMSGDDLEQMYQEVILEASKNPHGKEHFAPDLASENASQAGKTTVQATHEYCTPGESHQFNPTCGDEATVHVEVSDPGAARYRTTGVGRSRLLHFTGQPFGDGGSGGRQNRG